MKLRTRYNLFKIRKNLSPSAVFKSGLQKDLSKAWEARYGKVSWFYSGVMYRVGAVAVVALVLLGSGGAYAYTSPDVTEGSPLYPVKKAIEKVEEFTKVTPEAKAKFLIKKIERREAEKTVLERKDKLLKISEKLKNRKEQLGVNSENKKPISSDDQNDIEDGGKQLERKELEIRMNKADKSIEEAEDRLEKFSEDIEKVDLKTDFKAELKEKIEQRLEKRKQKLEKFRIKVEDKQDENNDRFREVRENVRGRFGSVQNQDRAELREEEKEGRN